MNRQRFIRILIVLGLILIVSYVVILLVSNQFGMLGGSDLIILAIVITLFFAFAYYNTMLSSMTKEREIMKQNLAFSEILYDLLHATSQTEDKSELYSLILSSAIRALKNGSKGSILDVRNPDKVKYVATDGFDKIVLEKMGLTLSDTYLYRETSGALDRTVIIKNSIEYNQDNFRDDEIQVLIEAGTEGILSTICTPIYVDNAIFGMINVDSSMKNAFTTEDIKIIEMFSYEVSRMIMYNRMMEENLYLSRYDAMTKIFNRGYFYELHKDLYKNSHDKGYVFIATDLNNLKEVNDTYGHPVGDKLIRHFTQTVTSFIDDQTIFGRYGGDEFNILMPEASKADAMALIDKVDQYLIKYPVNNNGNEIYASFSYGIVLYPEEEKDYKNIIKLGDQRMYDHKKQMKSQH